jgi:predicted amidohydrolase
VVLGRMTARVYRIPEAGEECVVVSWPVGEDGRKLYAGTALFARDGELLALARQTWIVPKA